MTDKISLIKAEIKRYKHKADERLKIKGRTIYEDSKDLALQNLCGNLLHFVDSLLEETVSDDLEEAADKYECEQQEKHKDRDNHDFDNYRDGFVDGLTFTYDAFKAGAEWQKQKTIDKAVEWLKSNLANYFGHESAYSYIEDFRKALEEG